MQTNQNPIWSMVETKREAFIELSDRIFDMPEIAYTETRSCAEHTQMLRAEGFRVNQNAAGIPTAVIGEAGRGGPVIAILLSLIHI